MSIYCSSSNTLPETCFHWLRQYEGFNCSPMVSLNPQLSQLSQQRKYVAKVCHCNSHGFFWSSSAYHGGATISAQWWPPLLHEELMAADEENEECLGDEEDAEGWEASGKKVWALGNEGGDDVPPFGGISWGLCDLFGCWWMLVVQKLSSLGIQKWQGKIPYKCRFRARETHLRLLAHDFPYGKLRSRQRRAISVGWENNRKLVDRVRTSCSCSSYHFIIHQW